MSLLSQRQCSTNIKSVMLGWTIRTVIILYPRLTNQTSPPSFSRSSWASRKPPFLTRTRLGLATPIFAGDWNNRAHFYMHQNFCACILPAESAGFWCSSFWTSVHSAFGDSLEIIRNLSRRTRSGCAYNRGGFSLQECWRTCSCCHRNLHYLTDYF